MKKIFIGTGIMLFATVLILSSCQKSNVTFGNKRITATWTLVSETSKSIEEGTSIGSYTTNTCGYSSNYTSSYSEVDSMSINGTTVKEYWSSSYTYDGVTESEKGDTTYTANDTFEITFNEDGTCSMKETSKETDEEGYPDNYDGEYTGYWNWIDSYEEKSGINIVMMDGVDDSYEMFLNIESLDKDELIFTYTSTYTHSGEYSEFWGTCEGDDIYRTLKTTGNGTESGSRVMNKVDVD